MKHILIVGSLGLIGSHVADRLCQNKEYNVEGVDDGSYGRLENLQCGIEFTLIDFDKLSQSFLNQFEVMVFSACVNIIASMREPERSYKVNATNASKLFKRFKGKIINTGTSSVYGQAIQIPTPEGADINCTEIYSKGKLVAETTLPKRGNYTGLRLSNVYSHRQTADNPCSGVIGKFIGNNLAGEPMTVNGHGEATRDYTYIDDTVNAIELAVELPPTNTICNIGTGRETSIMQLTEIISSITGKRNTMNFSPERPIDNITRRCLDCRKAEKLLGWKAKTSLEEGIRLTVEFMKAGMGEKV